MLTSVLNEHEKYDFCRKYIMALRNISAIVNNKEIINRINKHYFINAIRQSGISRNKAK